MAVKIVRQEGVTEQSVIYVESLRKVYKILCEGIGTVDEAVFQEERCIQIGA